MPIRSSIAPALVLGGLFAASASAAPLMRYSWNDCDPLVANRVFAGASVYVQTLSALGLEAPVQSFEVLIRIGTSNGSLLPPAWLFSDLLFGYGGCHPAGRVSTLLGGTACDTIPGLTTIASYAFLITPPLAYLSVQGTVAGSFTPQPSRRYTLFRIAFDHSGSVPGYGTPGACDGADEPMGFVIGEFFLNGVDQRGRAAWENCVLSWNGNPSYPPPSPSDCPYVVPAKNRTWGQIKTLYR